MGHVNIFNDKTFTVTNGHNDKTVGLNLDGNFAANECHSLLHPDAARALAADLLSMADKVDPQPQVSLDDSAEGHGDKGKGSYVAFVRSDPLTGADYLTPAVDCNGGVLRGEVLDNFEDALDAAERLIRGGTFGQVEVVELTVHKRGVVRQAIERTVA